MSALFDSELYRVAKSARDASMRLASVARTEGGNRLTE
jgi:hypothetical protein